MISDCDSDELHDLIGRLGLEPGAAARICHVDGRTFRRWLSGRHPPVASAIQLLRIAEHVPGAMAWLKTHRGAGLTD